MKLPELYLVKNNIPAPRVGDVKAEILSGLAALGLAEKIRPGDSVAITAGSRGVTDMVLAIKTAVSFFKGLGAKPFVAPSMGSHGGATDQGQADMLAHLGITEKTVGAPIVSSVEVEEIGRTSFDLPVYIGKDFCRADHVAVINRVKPHTSFRGAVESGLCKMMSIGMGKRVGAVSSHTQFFNHGFERVVREIGLLVQEKLPICCGIALVENFREETAHLRVVPPEKFWETDVELLQKARGLMGRVPFDKVHLLIVDEIGKNISGAGLDSNVTGRIMHQATPEPKERQFSRIFVRDLTPQSEGNGLGLGVAEFVARRLVDKLDIEKTRINCITASVPEKGRIPFTYETDLPAVRDALATAGVSDGEKARLVWIKNTLELERMWISAALLDEARAMENLELAKGPVAFPLDEDENLPFGTFAH